MELELVQVLLVEDNAGDAYLFRKALEEAELNVALTVIDDGYRALAFVRGEREYAGDPIPDLVVLDLNLPKHGGDEVLKAIAQSRRFEGVPVVITSSSPWQAAADRNRELTNRSLHPQAAGSGCISGDRYPVELKEVLLEGKARAEGKHPGSPG